ncbi:MAG: ribosome maturation factor RimM [Acetatifactor sp.]|nr:ribosome maturation factor RimM [Acetatifactor sp.]
MEKEFKIGVITQPHGVRGEVKVFPTTDDPGRFKKLKSCILDTGKERSVVEIESVKFFKQFVIIKFKGFDSMNDVERLRQSELLVEREKAVKLSKDEYFIADLIGIEVFDENDVKIGEITDVMQTGANDVYVVGTVSGEEILLPAIKDCILNVDIENLKMTVHIMDGLI